MYPNLYYMFNLASVLAPLMCLGTFSGMEDAARSKWNPGCLEWGFDSGDGAQGIKCVLCQIGKFCEEKPGRELREWGVEAGFWLGRCAKFPFCLAHSGLHCVPCFLSCFDPSVYYCLPACDDCPRGCSALRAVWQGLHGQHMSSCS